VRDQAVSPRHNPNGRLKPNRLLLETSISVCYNSPKMERHPLYVEEARTADAFHALRQEWDALVARCPQATLYQTFDWNEAWWNAFRVRKRLRIIVVRRGPEVLGVLPLYVSPHLGTPLRRLAFLGTGSSDYMDLIVEPSQAMEVWGAIGRHLAHRPGYDLADLQHLSPNSVLRNLLEPRLDAGHDRLAQLRPQEPCPYLALSPTWDEMGQRLGKKMRSNIGYYDRLLSRTFSDAETRLTEPEELDEAMTELFDLHQKRWNARLLPGVLGGARIQSFHREVARRFQEKGALRMHVTRVGGRTVAALYCYRFRDRYYYYLGGFQPDLAKYSLGTVLTAHAIKQAISEGCTEFDFLRGDEDYKYRWTETVRLNYRLLLPRPRSIRSGAMLRLNHLEQYVEHRAKAFAAKRARSKRT
jgi:CelD/BcsL family acetyltransferase involved in cellulose biosynthesis